MKNSIIIKTRIHESCSGSGVFTYFNKDIGPRNLMAAISELPTHRKSMGDGYGNVGHCGSWIEIGGVVMEDTDISDYNFTTDPSNFQDSGHAISKTSWCKKFIDSCLSGEITKNRREDAKWQKSIAAAKTAGEDAAHNGFSTPPKYDNSMLAVICEEAFTDTLEMIEIHRLVEQDNQL